ncbi:MAG: hypothetical protein V3T33_01525 [Myxococcota bacterium]
MGKEKRKRTITSDRSRPSEGSDPKGPDEPPTDARRDSSEVGGSGHSAGQSVDDPSGRIAAIPDLIRRAMAVGFSSFFTTEEAIRKALGDTLPQDWVEFASTQSDRTRQEFIDRLAQEFGRVVENMDLYQMAERLLDGRTIEVTAQIRFGSRSDPPAPGAEKITLDIVGTRKKEKKR